MNGQYVLFFIVLLFIGVFFVLLIKGFGRKVVMGYLVFIIVFQIVIVGWVVNEVYFIGKLIIVMVGGWKLLVGINFYIGYFVVFFVFIIVVISFFMVFFSFRVVIVELVDKYVMFFFLLMFGVMGMIVMGDFFNLFVFMEIILIIVYVFIVYNKIGEVVEVLMKYIVFGGIGLSFFFIGVVFIYGVIGIFNMVYFVQFVGVIDLIVVQVGFVLIIFGLVVEVELFLFNVWVLDVYQVVLYLIIVMFLVFVVKVGFYVIVRFFYIFQNVNGWSGVFKLVIIMVILIVVVVEFLVLRQKDVKRMIVYFLISQVGMIVFVFVFGIQVGVDVGVFYMVNYVIVKVFFFFMVGYVGVVFGGIIIENFQGFGKRMFLMVLIFIIGFFVVVGILFFNIFWSKVRIFFVGVEVGYFWSVVFIFGVSVVEVVYYFRLIYMIWFVEGGERVRENFVIGVIVIFFVVLIIVIGVYLNDVWIIV